MRESIREMWEIAGLGGIIAGLRHNMSHNRAAAVDREYTELVVETPHGEPQTEIQETLGRVVAAQEKLDITGGKLGPKSHLHQ